MRGIDWVATENSGITGSLSVWGSAFRGDHLWVLKDKPKVAEEIGL